MKIEYDPIKSAQNSVKRRFPFALAAQFDFESAYISQDTRRDYGEIRYSAIGMIRERLHVLVFKEIPSGIRVISLRKANSREVFRYEKARA
ncbi:BrnT family toxin [Alcaligenaceae bacterium CGII-47]|nr:BrnT family toxin [Alcaligenaceae bacterium CGII-47]